MEDENEDGRQRARWIANALSRLAGRPAVTTEARGGGIRVTLRVTASDRAAELTAALLRVLRRGDRFGHADSARWERVWAEVDQTCREERDMRMTPVEYYPHGHAGLPWHAVGEDPDGLLVAETGDGVALALATDPRKVFVLPPDEWADLCEAAKAGRFDQLLGGGALCADPRRWGGRAVEGAGAGAELLTA
ncbi:hypothetical protein [Kitasatospora cheerisanensis]|uniref:Uncharacterized protein n=1 Tax=Kitasatospora cheerisanensis KCTC 2395 TaxID=1348663 RepID=A0A066YUH7_9ACTN|nr:hypothetical protein [Kitasatospora cheerisanensis]KDN81731.1 hypothetical protein KCH_64510 [Kitasatospora cheerisanensis KCTC 2395]